MSDDELKNYWVKVVVHYEYEVEASDEAEAEAEGWNYEDYKFNADVYSIKVKEIEINE